MSPAKVLNFLQSGEIIVTGGNDRAPLRLRLQSLARTGSRADAGDGGKPQDLLRSLVALRKEGKK